MMKIKENEISQLNRVIKEKNELVHNVQTTNQALTERVGKLQKLIIKLQTEIAEMRSGSWDLVSFFLSIRIDQ